MTFPKAPRTGEGAIAPRLRIDGALAERSTRFALTVMAPIGISIVVGPQSWLLYAVVSAIVSFAGDAGGRPLARLCWMSTGPAALALGLALGSAALGNAPFVIALSMTAGLLYGIVETGHPHLLLTTRFFAFGIVLAGLVSIAVPIDYLAIAGMLLLAWLISLTLDLTDGKLRALSVPAWATIVPGVQLRASDRWLFGLSVALSIGIALAATAYMGSLRPSWACLTILMVLRSEITSSVRLAIERVIGTLGGVITASLLAGMLNHRGLIIAMAVMAFVRWPAQQVHNALGVFCLTAFVLLMIEIATPDHTTATLLLHERLTDTFIGAAAAGIGVLVYHLLRSRLAVQPGK